MFDVRRTLNFELRTSRDYRPDLHRILIFQPLILGDEIVTANDQMGFRNKIEVSQELADALRTLDHHPPFRVAQLDIHAGMISFGGARGNRPLKGSGLSPGEPTFKIRWKGAQRPQPRSLLAH
jgi:hypothetical protein